MASSTRSLQSSPCLMCNPLLAEAVIGLAYCTQLVTDAAGLNTVKAGKGKLLHFATFAQPFMEYTDFRAGLNSDTPASDDDPYLQKRLDLNSTPLPAMSTLLLAFSRLLRGPNPNDFSWRRYGRMRATTIVLEYLSQDDQKKVAQIGIHSLLTPQWVDLLGGVEGYAAVRIIHKNKIRGWDCSDSFPQGASVVRWVDASGRLGLGVKSSSPIGEAYVTIRQRPSSSIGAKCFDRRIEYQMWVKDPAGEWQPKVPLEPRIAHSTITNAFKAHEASLPPARKQPVPELIEAVLSSIGMVKDLFPLILGYLTHTDCLKEAGPWALRPDVIRAFGGWSSFNQIPTIRDENLWTSLFHERLQIQRPQKVSAILDARRQEGLPIHSVRLTKPNTSNQEVLLVCIQHRRKQRPHIFVFDPDPLEKVMGSSSTIENEIGYTHLTPLQQVQYIRDGFHPDFQMLGSKDPITLAEEPPIIPAAPPPQTETSTLAMLDRVLDYIPGLSLISNLLDLFIKYVWIPNAVSRIEKTNSLYYRYLDKKTWKECFLFSIPFAKLVMTIGTFLLGSSKKEQLAQEIPTPQLYS